MDIDSSLIGEKFTSNEDWKKIYGPKFDYETMVDERLTLTNRVDMKGAFKVLACICATEVAQKLNEQSKTITPKSERFLELLREVKSGWKKTESYHSISPTNNPFYLAIIEQQLEYQKALNQLLTENQLQNLQLQPTK